MSEKKSSCDQEDCKTLCILLISHSRPERAGMGMCKGRGTGWILGPLSPVVSKCARKALAPTHPLHVLSCSFANANATAWWCVAALGLALLKFSAAQRKDKPPASTPQLLWRGCTLAFESESLSKSKVRCAVSYVRSGALLDHHRDSTGPTGKQSRDSFRRLLSHTLFISTAL